MRAKKKDPRNKAEAAIRLHELEAAIDRAKHEREHLAEKIKGIRGERRTKYQQMCALRRMLKKLHKDWPGLKAIKQLELPKT